MESQPQNPKFRIDPENFHPCADIQMKTYSNSVRSYKQVTYHCKKFHGIILQSQQSLVDASHSILVFFCCATRSPF